MAKRKFTNFVPRPKPRKRPGRHTKNLNKSKKRSYKKYNRQGRWQILLNDYPIVMKEKTITIKTNEISQRQYSTLLLELNIMKRQWKSYGVDIQLSAPSLKKIIALGTTNGSDTNKRRIV